MTRQVRGSIWAAVIGLAFVALELAFRTATGIAGVFVLGVAGGLLLGTRMAEPVAK